MERVTLFVFSPSQKGQPAELLGTFGLKLMVNHVGKYSSQMEHLGSFAALGVELRLRKTTTVSNETKRFERVNGNTFRLFLWVLGVHQKGSGCPKVMRPKPLLAIFFYLPCDALHSLADTAVAWQHVEMSAVSMKQSTE